MNSHFGPWSFSGAVLRVSGSDLFFSTSKFMLHEMLDIAVKRKEETLVDHSKHIGTLINLLLMEMRTYLGSPIWSCLLVEDVSI